MKTTSYKTKRKDGEEEAFLTLRSNPDSLHPSLGSLNRCAVPFEGFLDFAGQGRFARRLIVNELFFGSDLHASHFYCGVSLVIVPFSLL
jgi:hypothetical protein